MAIIVYNRTKESHSDSPNNFRIYRPFVLGNPYSTDVDSTKAIYKVSSREDAIKAYDHYFDIMYRSNLKFKKVVDLIYEKYKAGEDIYLECCCKKYPTRQGEVHDDEVRCHGDVIKEKLEKRLLKEKIEEMKNAKAE